jgi:type II secretory ATPase GspE/PulE/Tfp pilus assembly ATPase PilB-like protein
VERIYHPQPNAPIVLVDAATDRFDEVYVHDQESGGSAAEIAGEIMRRAVALGATDIHIEPFEDTTRVRYRLDGMLQEAATYPRTIQAPLLTRVKILAGLNIAESRLPQDGRFRFQASDREVDLRISTFPTMHGEDVVLRVLARARVPLDLARLGIVRDDLAFLRDAARRPHGMIAVTGPAGSGKTTTLYAALNELNTNERCILTLEDPVEYELPGIRQSQINVRAGLTFASGLRSMLRHDPDVILVGEMRDEETVQIALSAALTGHLVLTTLHTNTAAGAIPRLLDMGAEPFLLASAILLVVSQRLVRRLCESCREEMLAPDAAVQRFKLPPGSRVYRAVGCAGCRGSGYRGRVAIFELLPITAHLTEAIYERRSGEEIERISQRPRLLQDGVRKVLNGETSLDELLRVTS